MTIDTNRVKEIFLQAVDLTDAAARAVYLDRVCGGDTGLRARVETLLRSHDPEGSFLGTPAAIVPDPDPNVTRALTGSPDPGAEDEQTTDGENDNDAEESLAFLSPPTRPDSLGRLGHYEVLQVLGKGGFGIVFRAFDEMLQRVVALKVMAPQLAATSPARKRFLREARSSAQVRHENVVQVYEVAEQPLPYLVMEFIPGETLQQKLNRLGPLDVPEVLRIGRQIAEGLSAAHATDLIHRDIKPGNVLLEGGQNKVKITDFGLARAADDASISQSGIIAGTTMYMAPEQAQGQTLDQRADLFSLGSVLYQMATGRPPFRANNTVAVLKRVAEDQPRAIREIIPETPQWLCDIIAKLHAKNPDDRYPSAREVADVLADCEAQLKANAKLKDYSRIPRSKPKAGRPERRVAWRKRAGFAAVAALLLAFMALALTEIAGITHLMPKQQSTTDPIDSGNGPAPVTRKDTPPSSLPALVKDAVLLMNFEKETFYQKDGKTYVRDLSGHGHDGLCENVSFTAVGKVGGGLLCQHEKAWPTDVPAPDGEKDLATGLKLSESLVTGQPNFTIAAWCRMEKADPTHLYLSGPEINPRSPHFIMGSYRERRFSLDCYNTAHGSFECWLHAITNPGALPDREWFFVAASLSDGAVGSGRLSVHINRQKYSFDSQMAVANRTDKNLVDIIGFSTSGAVIDELAVFQRTLSDREIMAIYEAGLKGEMLGRAGQTPLPIVESFTDADAKRITVLPAEQQVEEVRKELMRRNPVFDGKLGHKIEDGVVTEFKIVTDQVTDIAPIRVFDALRVLDCGGTLSSDKRNGQLADLTPLEKMNLAGLKHLRLSNTKVTDAGMATFKDCKNLLWVELWGTNVTDAGLANFKDCKNLTDLSLGNTQVSDAGLIHLKDYMHLAHLTLEGTQVSDAGLAHLKNCKALTHLYLKAMNMSDAGLSHLKGIPLKLLWIDNTAITDLTPLQGMPLEEIRLTPKNITQSLDILREMKSLKTIGIDWDQAWPAAEFWERYDKGEFK